MNSHITKGYTQLIARKLKALGDLTQLLKQSREAFTARDARALDDSSRRQAELCQEIAFLDRDIKSAEEILVWAQMRSPNTTEIWQLRKQTICAEKMLGYWNSVQSAMVRQERQRLNRSAGRGLPFAFGFAAPFSPISMELAEE